MNARLAETLHKWTWIILVLLLPVTSLPLMARLTGASSVAAPSAILLLVLVQAWFIPHILRGGRLPHAVVPLIGFVLLALISAAGAYFLPIPAFREFNLLRSELEALLTLAIGVCFYLVAASWPRTAGQLRNIFIWVNLAGAVIILWSLVQAVYWRVQTGYPDWMYRVQDLISASGNLYPGRATGLAYEPSWLAHQLNLLFLPYWLAATVQRSSAMRFRLLRRISLENILLLGGVLVLYLSLSRVGWLSFLACLAYLILLANVRLVHWARARFQPHLQSSAARRALLRLLPALLSIGLVIAYLGLGIGSAYLLSKVDFRMARLFDPALLEQGGLLEIANQLVFAERVVFWQTGLEVFNKFPILGVGPGNVGYFFPTDMPAFGWALHEVSLILHELDSLPNAKSMWVRILAENGIVGLSVFAGWLFLQWTYARQIKHLTADPFLRTMEMMTALVVVALIVEGFSVDTYALPYFWLALGWGTAAAWIARRQKESVHE